MPYHLEISSLVDRARLLNVDQEELREAVLEPWVSGLPFDFGERSWKPRESRLTVLEGPAPEGTDATDEAWEALLRAAQDVTRAQLEAAEASAPIQAAATIAASSLELAVKSLRGGHAPEPIHWSAAIARLNERDPEVIAVILIVKRPEGEWPQP